MIQAISSLTLTTMDELFSVPFLHLNIFSWAVFFLSLLVESNRAPFDLAESESEIIAGFTTEYSS